MLRSVSIWRRGSWAIACLMGMLSIPWVGGNLAGTVTTGMVNVFLHGTGRCDYAHVYLHLAKLEVSQDGSFWETLPMSPHARQVDLLDPMTGGVSFLGQKSLRRGRYRMLRVSLHEGDHTVHLVGLKKPLPLHACEDAQTTYFLPIDWDVPAGTFSNFLVDVNTCQAIWLHEASTDQPMTACFDGFKASHAWGAMP